MTNPNWSNFIIKVTYDKGGLKPNESKCKPKLSFVCRFCQSFRTSNRTEAIYHLASIHNDIQPTLKTHACSSKTLSAKTTPTNEVSMKNVQASSTFRGEISFQISPSPNSPPDSKPRKSVAVNMNFNKKASLASVFNVWEVDELDGFAHIPIDVDHGISTGFEQNVGSQLRTVSHKMTNPVTRPCPLCGVRAKDCAALQRHLKRKHEVYESIESLQASDRLRTAVTLSAITGDSPTNETGTVGPIPVHTCSVCERNFLSQRALKTHSWAHQRRQRLTCSLCRRHFPFMSSLRRHCIDEHDIVLDPLALPFRAGNPRDSHRDEYGDDTQEEKDSDCTFSQSSEAYSSSNSTGDEASQSTTNFSPLRRGCPRGGCARGRRPGNATAASSHRRPHSRRPGRPRLESRLPVVCSAVHRLPSEQVDSNSSECRYRTILPKPCQLPLVTRPFAVVDLGGARLRGRGGKKQPKSSEDRFTLSQSFSSSSGLLIKPVEQRFAANGLDIATSLPPVVARYGTAALAKENRHALSSLEAATATSDSPAMLTQPMSVLSMDTVAVSWAVDATSGSTLPILPHQTTSSSCVQQLCTAELRQAEETTAAGSGRAVDGFLASQSSNCQYYYCYYYPCASTDADSVGQFCPLPPPLLCPDGGLADIQPMSGSRPLREMGQQSQVQLMQHHNLVYLNTTGSQLASVGQLGASCDLIVEKADSSEHVTNEADDAEGKTVAMAADDSGAKVVPSSVDTNNYSADESELVQASETIVEVVDLNSCSRRHVPPLSGGVGTGFTSAHHSLGTTSMRDVEMPDVR